VKFLIDAMLPPQITEALNAAGHDAVTPTMLGAQNLPDDVLIELTSADGRTIVTENARDFAHVAVCPVLFVRKSWWPGGTLTDRLPVVLDEWAARNPDPGTWPHWLSADLR